MFILQNLYELLGKASFIQNMLCSLIHHLKATTVTRTQTRSHHHLLRWSISLSRGLASATHRVQHHLKLVEQALGPVVEVNVAVVSLATMEVGPRSPLRCKSNNDIHPLILFLILYSVLTT